MNTSWQRIGFFIVYTATVTIFFGLLFTVDGCLSGNQIRGQQGEPMLTSTFLEKNGFSMDQKDQYVYTIEQMPLWDALHLFGFTQRDLYPVPGSYRLLDVQMARKGEAVIYFRTPLDGIHIITFQQAMEANSTCSVWVILNGAQRLPGKSKSSLAEHPSSAE
jgi:hypothetical protein